MRFRKFIIATIVSLFAISNSSAQLINVPLLTRSKSALESKVEPFALETPFNIVYMPTQPSSEVLAKRIASFLKNKGVETSTISNIQSSRNITITLVESIGGYEKGEDAYYIKITKNNVLIEYTSSSSLSWALDAFTSRYHEKQSFIQKLSKRKKTYIEGFELMTNKGEESGSSVIKLVSSDLTYNNIKGRIKGALASNNTTIYLQLLSKDGCALRLNAIELFNPSAQYSQINSLTLAQLEELHDYAMTLGVTLVPYLDFSKESNPPFEKFTGHKIYSAEGLRLSKAMVRELSSISTLSSVCLGAEVKDELIKKKYIDPLTEILHKLGKRSVAIQ